MSCFPDMENKDIKANNPRLLRAGFMLGMIFFVSVLVIGQASAYDCVNASGNLTECSGVNWTGITEMIDGVANIMPSITNLITEVISPMILLVIVGFLIGLFDNLLNGISNALNFGRR